MSFTYYAQIAAADDGNCANDTLSVQVAVNGAAPVNLAADACAGKTAASNPMGWSQQPTSKKMSYDVTSLAGKTVGVQFAWANNATNNAGLGAIIDNVQLSCTLPWGKGAAERRAAAIWCRRFATCRPHAVAVGRGQGALASAGSGGRQGQQAVRGEEFDDLDGSVEVDWAE